MVYEYLCVHDKPIRIKNRCHYHQGKEDHEYDQAKTEHLCLGKDKYLLDPNDMGNKVAQELANMYSKRNDFFVDIAPSYCGCKNSI